MHPIDRTGWGRVALRRPFPAPLVPLIILLFLAAATLASQTAVFPLFPIFAVALQRQQEFPLLADPARRQGGRIVHRPRWRGGPARVPGP